MVYDEIAVGTDTLSVWIKNIQNLEPLNHKNQEFINHYADILNFIQTSGFYKIDALNSWALPTVADPFLVAAAIENHYTIINWNDVAPAKEFTTPFQMDIIILAKKLKFRNSSR